MGTITLWDFIYGVQWLHGLQCFLLHCTEVCSPFIKVPIVRIIHSVLPYSNLLSEIAFSMSQECNKIDSFCSHC